MANIPKTSTSQLHSKEFRQKTQYYEGALKDISAVVVSFEQTLLESDCDENQSRECDEQQEKIIQVLEFKEKIIAELDILEQPISKKLTKSSSKVSDFIDDSIAEMCDEIWQTLGRKWIELMNVYNRLDTVHTLLNNLYEVLYFCQFNPATVQCAQTTMNIEELEQRKLHLLQELDRLNSEFTQYKEQNENKYQRVCIYHKSITEENLSEDFSQYVQNF